MDALYYISDIILQCNPLILEDVKYLSTKVILIYAGVSKRLIFHTMHTFRGSIFIFKLIIEFTFGTFLATYLSTLRCLSILSTIVQKGGDCWCKFLAPCVLEIVVRNSEGLICLLVHTQRNSPWSIKKIAIICRKVCYRKICYQKVCCRRDCYNLPKRLLPKRLL